MVELYAILIFIIVASVVAVEIKDLLSSVIAVGAAGLGLSIAFLVLKAPDLAITQIVVEILCLIILIRATLKKDLPFSTSGRWFVNTFILFLFFAAFLFCAWFCLKELPEFGKPVMRIAEYYLSQGLARTGATNLVASVILDFRAYDTLGEATILFTAVIGVLAIARSIGRKKEGKDVDK